MRHLFFLATLIPAPALAAQGWDCRFETECQDAECAESGYRASVTLAGDMATLTDPSESVELTAPDHAQRLTGSFAKANRLLTVTTDGAALYTTHMTDPPMAITYIGRCEEAK